MEAISIPIVSGLFVSLELILLLFGAYLFYAILSSNKHFDNFTKTTAQFSSRLSVVILLCVFMGAFLEGIAGFGIPAMLIAPLLLTLGFKPLSAIVLPLSANTLAVTYGALGTPFKIGFGIHSPDITTQLTSLLVVLPILGLPFIVTFLYSKSEQVEVKWGDEWKMLLGAGCCFLVPFTLTSLVSIEYPSVVGGLVGLFLFVTFFIPKKESPSPLFWWNTFYPYLLFVVLLIVSKLIFAEYTWQLNADTKTISMYQPGLVFILSGVIYLLITHRSQFALQFAKQSKATFFKIIKSVATVILLVCFAQLIQNDVSVLAQSHYSDLSDTFKLFVTPIMGISGSFILGTATMSNLLFGEGVKASVAIASQLPLYLALLNAGSCIGNAISFQNIIMVKSVINDPVSETSVLRFTLLAVGIYLVLITCSAFVVLAAM